MRLSEGVEWAVHSCTVLAALPNGRALGPADLAAFFDVPKAYLAKQLQALSKAGILGATRGPSGGYRLARGTGDITLRDIVQAIEPPGPSFRCQEIRRRGPTGQPRRCYPMPCGIARAMWAAERVYLAELEKVTLAKLIAEAGHEVSKEQQTAMSRWLQRVA
jgi:Rrf2 family protein